jgi:Flp pilus assembly protein TadD
MQLLRHLSLDNAAQIAQDDFDHLGDPIPDDYMHLALLLEPAQAIEVLQAGIARWPEHAGLTERCVDLLRASQNAEAALALLRNQPSGWRWLQMEGDLLAEQGEVMLATARYSQALSQLADLKPNPHLEAIKARLYLLRAASYRRQGFLDQAMQDYQAAEAIVPDDPVIPFNRGLIVWLQGDPEAALVLCRPALAQANDRLQAEMLGELHDNPQYKRLLAKLTP